MGGGGVTAGGPTPSPICILHYIYGSLCKLIMKDKVEELNKIILFAKRTSIYGKSLVFKIKLKIYKLTITMI